jgi:hypothetical protein
MFPDEGTCTERLVRCGFTDSDDDKSLSGLIVEPGALDGSAGKESEGTPSDEIDTDGIAGCVGEPIPGVGTDSVVEEDWSAMAAEYAEHDADANPPNATWLQLLNGARASPSRLAGSNTAHIIPPQE